MNERETMEQVLAKSLNVRAEPLRLFVWEIPKSHGVMKATVAHSVAEARENYRRKGFTASHEWSRCVMETVPYSYPLDAVITILEGSVKSSNVS